MVKQVCSKVDSCIDCVQPLTRLRSVKVLILELLVRVLLLHSPLLVSSMCLTVQRYWLSVYGMQTHVLCTRSSNDRLLQQEEHAR